MRAKVGQHIKYVGSTKWRDEYSDILEESLFNIETIKISSIKNNFCDSIESKTLLPLRNKVCDHSYEIDSKTRLSYEAIHDGVCLCEKC